MINLIYNKNNKAMGYEHIEHLYKHPEFFKNYANSKECNTDVYALEKIHGTSTWIDYVNVRNLDKNNEIYEIDEDKNKDDQKVNDNEYEYIFEDFHIRFHSAGERPDAFAALFDHKFLKQQLFQLVSNNNWYRIKVHGEGYGGKQQKMADTYGPNLKFIVFDVKVFDKIDKIDNNNNNNGRFLDIAKSEQIAKQLNLEFVHYEIGQCTPEWFDQQTKTHSIQAIRNGMGEGKLREGIIVRPLLETLTANGDRIIYKHKNPEFWETTSERPLGEKLVVMNDAQQIANEWVTKQRAEHVVNHIISDREQKEIAYADISILVKEMIEDIKRESIGEVEWSKLVEKEIKKRSGNMFRNMIILPLKHKSC